MKQENNYGFTPAEECYFKYLPEFSMEELIPVLESKISSLMGKEYKIDSFITNIEESDYLELRYLAFPKQDDYMKALFSYKNRLYIYTKHTNGNDTMSIDNCDYTNIDFKDILDIQESNNTFLIAKKTIKIHQVLEHLLKESKDSYLSDSFFCYPEELDSISDTIVDFAKKKVHK